VVVQKQVSGYYNNILQSFTIFLSYSYVLPNENAGYKLSFYATYGTAETEMFCFDTVARQIVGKSCEILVKSMNASTSTPIELSEYHRTELYFCYKHKY
jgi:hypothetical protein